MQEEAQINIQFKRGFVLPILFIILVLMGFGWRLASQSHHNQFSGWITGLIPDSKGSVLVAINPVNHEINKILSLPDVSPDQYGAVSSNGKYTAYTQWNQDNTVVYLNIEEPGKENSKRIYFSNVLWEQVIYYLSWLPDSRNLLLVRSKKEVYHNQEICIFDVKNNTLKHLVKGGVWDGTEIVDVVNGKKVYKYHMSQEQLNQLIKEYGGPKTIPAEENGRKSYVRFSSPSVSPDGSTIAYSATLFRDFAMEGNPLWLASSIWTVSVNGGEPKRVYCNPEVATTIGRITWSSDGKRLVFYRYQGINGENGRLDCLDLATGKVKTVVPVTEQHYTNLNALTLPNNEISFISVPKQSLADKAQQYIVNLDSEEIRPDKIFIDNKNIIMWNFSNLY